MAEIFVAGSINQDFTLKVEQRPEPGETVTDAGLTIRPGGKGANQAAAAALLGSSVAMLGRVGEDSLGEAMLTNLRNKGIDTTYAKTLAGTSTGAAFITLTQDGENAIVVSPGANERLLPHDVDNAEEAIREARVLMAQMEIPPETVQRATEVAADVGTRVILNLAPMREINKKYLRFLDPIVVNKHEAASLLGSSIEDTEGALKAAPRLLSLGPRSAVITLGDAGAIAADREAVEHFSAPSVKVVDTTGAGDAFVGALASKLAWDNSFWDAVEYAVRAGTKAVTKEGAQGSLPTSDVVESL